MNRPPRRRVHPETKPDGPDASGQLGYTLDGTDRIVAVAGEWDRFALADGGRAIVGCRVAGRPLDEYIAGDITRMFVRTMLMSARTMQRPIQRPYRCDSPGLRRFMEMTILPGEGGHIEVLHRQIRSEACRHPLPVTAVPAGSSVPLVKRCSLCNRIRIGQSWQEIDDAICRGHRPQALSTALTVVFGLCPDCLEQRHGCRPGAASPR